MRFDPKLEAVTAFRAFRPEDMKCVTDNWLKAFRDSPYAGCVTNDQYFDVHYETLRQLFTRGTKILVACNKDDVDQIIGWVAVEDVKGGVAVHFVYVKDGFRKRGLGTELVRRAVDAYCTRNNVVSPRRFYTFRTRASSYLFRDWQHEPAIVRRKK